MEFFSRGGIFHSPSFGWATVTLQGGQMMGCEIHKRGNAMHTFIEPTEGEVCPSRDILKDVSQQEGFEGCVRLRGQGGDNLVSDLGNSADHCAPLTVKYQVW